jgi:hypothetical protein
MNTKKLAVLLAAACAALALGREGRADHGGNAITWGPVVGRQGPRVRRLHPGTRRRRAPLHQLRRLLGPERQPAAKGLHGVRADRRRPVEPGRAGPADPGPHRLRRPRRRHEAVERARGRRQAVHVGPQLRPRRHPGPPEVQRRLHPTSGSNWTWAPWTLTQFGYPVFVQGAPGPYHYIVAHDNNSAYKPADRFVLMRVPVGKLLERSAYRYFSGTAAAPAWTDSYAGRRPILTAPGQSFRSGVSYSKARGRYYWWRNNGDGKTRAASRSGPRRTRGVHGGGSTTPLIGTWTRASGASSRSRGWARNRSASGHPPPALLRLRPDDDPQGDHRGRPLSARGERPGRGAPPARPVADTPGGP